MALSFTVSEKLPKASVIVPFCVPFSTMLTPGRLVPSSDDVTLPVTTLLCANPVKADRKHSMYSSRLFIRALVLVEFQSIVQSNYRDLESPGRNKSFRNGLESSILNYTHN